MKTNGIRIFGAVLALAGAAGLPGCGSAQMGGTSLMGGMLGIPQQPQRRDTYAGLDAAVAPPAFPELTLAVMQSENTKAAIEYAYKGSAWSNFDPRALQEKERAMYRRNFKAVVQVERVQDARAVNADLVGLLDNFAAVGRSTKLDYKTVFLTLDNQKIDEITASGEKSMAWNAGKQVEELTDEVLGKIEAGLRASSSLAEFAKTHGGAAPAAKSQDRAPVAPAAKRIHSDADKPAYQHPEDPRNFALVVGIEKYENLPPAEFAERDAQAVRRHLLALGYPERNVIFLTGSKAGRSGIEKYVESWLPRNVGPDDRVFVYFSGHGAPDAETEQAYLAPWDADVKFLSNTGYPVKRLYEKLNALKAKEVLVALDACFSGAGGRSVLAKGTRPLVTRVDTGVGEGKVAVLSASAADEITGTDESQGHGIFTYHLLSGLNAAQGDASFQGLYSYLKPKVQDAARRDNRDQTPQLMPEGLQAGTPLKLR